MMRIVVTLGVLAALCFVSREAEARIERFAVCIGHNIGAAGEVALRYAETDASKVCDVLKDLGGFAPANVVLLRSENADAVRHALITVNDRIRQAASSPDTQVLLAVYYSGHADTAALHLGGTSLDLSQLEQLVRGSAAAFRLLIVDACRSGALTRVKGGTSAPPIAIRLDDRLAGQGVVFLTSNSANEDAQESDALKGSFFTHYLVSGLMGAADADGDGSVALEEAYRHAYGNTLRATSRTFAGPQHATFRYELRGQGKVVLTAPSGNGKNRGTVTVPSGRTYVLLAGGSSGPVVAEISGRDTSRRISVKPGTYFVLGRDKDYLLEGSITVAPGEVAEASDDRLARVAYARLVRKGQGPGFTHGPQAGYRYRTAFAEGASGCNGFFVGYAFEAEHLNLVPRIGFCRATHANETLSGRTDQVDLELRLAHAWDLPVLSVDLGVSVGAGVLHQEFNTQGVAPDRTSFVGSIGAGIGVTADLPGGFYLLGEAVAQTYCFKARDPDSPDEDSVDAVFAVRPLAGIGKRF